MEENATAVADGQVVQPALFDLEELTVKNTLSIKQLQDQAKELRDMRKSVYAQSESYVETEAKLKEAKEDLTTLTKALNTNPEIGALNDRLKQIQQEIKEKRMSASDYALSYMEMTGKTSIERDGEVYEMVKVAKVKRRALRKKKNRVH